MKLTLKTTLAAAFLAAAVAHQASAQAILFWADYNVGSSAMQSALASLPGSFSVTTAADDADFTAKLNAGGYDLAILDIQNYGPGNYTSSGALLSYVALGGKAIVADWYVSDPSFIAPLGAAFTGSTNQNVFSVTLPSFATGISNPVTLSNPGWGVFSTDLSTGATVAGTFGDGSAAIVVGNGGRTVVNGFLDDTFADKSQGEQLYRNEITTVLGGSSRVPDSGSTAGLLGLALISLLAIARRNRKS